MYSLWIITCIGLFIAPVLSVANIETCEGVFTETHHLTPQTFVGTHGILIINVFRHKASKGVRRPPLVPSTDTNSGIKAVNPWVGWILRAQSYLASECRKSYFSERVPPIPLKKTAFGCPNPFSKFLCSPRTWAFYFAIFLPRHLLPNNLFTLPWSSMRGWRVKEIRINPLYRPHSQIIRIFSSEVPRGSGNVQCSQGRRFLFPSGLRRISINSRNIHETRVVVSAEELGTTSKTNLSFTLVVHSFTFHSVSCIDNKTKCQWLYLVLETRCKLGEHEMLRQHKLRASVSQPFLVPLSFCL